MSKETAAVKDSEQIFGDEMLQQIAEAEAEMEQPGAQWHDAFDTLRDIRNKYDL